MTTFKICFFFAGAFLLMPFSASAAGVSVPKSYADGVSVSSPGNMQFRFQLNSQIKFDAYNCSLFYFEGTESAASQKYETMMAGYLSGHGMFFQVDYVNKYNSSFCHVTEVGILPIF